MRDSKKIKQIILDKAVSDKRIRAVLLNGSRANNKIQPDLFQDYDIVFVVDEINTFISDHSWTSIFGNKLLWQLPEEMVFGRNEETFSFPYLMLFDDGNRIDLTLFPAEKLKDCFKVDSLTVVWLDKDKSFSNIKTSSDIDYLIKQPSEKEFIDTCNEFWWVSIYVAKGLIRNEIIYAKEMMEIPVRSMFMKILEWYVGIKTDFLVSFGKSGKFIEKYLSVTEYKRVLNTYSDFKSENIETSLFIMIDLFCEIATSIADKLNFGYNMEEQNNAIKYIKQILNENEKSR